MAGRCETTRFVLRRAILSRSVTAVAAGCAAGLACCGGGGTTLTVVIFGFGALAVGVVAAAVAAAAPFVVGADGFVFFSCVAGSTGAVGVLACVCFVVCTRAEERVGGDFSHRKTWQERNGRDGFKVRERIKREKKKKCARLTNELFVCLHCHARCCLWCSDRRYIRRDDKQVSGRSRPP